MMFSQSTLNAARQMQQRAMPDRCTLYSPPATTAANKGEDTVATYPDDWTVVTSNVRCRLSAVQFRGSRESAAAGRVESQTAFEIALPYGTTLPGMGGRVRVTTKGNRDFEIRGNPDSSYDSCVVIECDEVK